MLTMNFLCISGFLLVSDLFGYIDDTLRILITQEYCLAYTVYSNIYIYVSKYLQLVIIILLST